MNNDQISVRMVVLLLVGALTVVVALYHPALGAAIGIGVVVVALLNELMGRQSSAIQPLRTRERARTVSVRARGLFRGAAATARTRGVRCR
ncbi:hypothetical protein [Streptomyces sp. CNQ085]|uniref:hypothetical protein n=1 Tax=Streptomyces sp. CNQ085 TaxID=2886944 RepID=UPI001F50AD3A|nr:hypothetical protein [Streptomyces sp. CNQ085]MCI0384738.1 hypothetical protein [Streptomyces sp. CNQ085]